MGQVTKSYGTLEVINEQEVAFLDVKTPSPQPVVSVP